MSESDAVWIAELTNAREQLCRAEQRVVELADDNERLRQELQAARGSRLVDELHEHAAPEVVQRLRTLGVSID